MTQPLTITTRQNDPTALQPAPIILPRQNDPTDFQSVLENRNTQLHFTRCGIQLARRIKEEGDEEHHRIGIKKLDQLCSTARLLRYEMKDEAEDMIGASHGLVLAYLKGIIDVGKTEGVSI